MHSALRRSTFFSRSASSQLPLRRFFGSALFQGELLTEQPASYAMYSDSMSLFQPELTRYGEQTLQLMRSERPKVGKKEGTTSPWRLAQELGEMVSPTTPSSCQVTSIDHC